MDTTARSHNHYCEPTHNMSRFSWNMGSTITNESSLNLNRDSICLREFNFSDMSKIISCTVSLLLGLYVDQGRSHLSASFTLGLYVGGQCCSHLMSPLHSLPFSLNSTFQKTIHERELMHLHRLLSLCITVLLTRMIKTFVLGLVKVILLKTLLENYPPFQIIPNTRCGRIKTSPFPQNCQHHHNNSYLVPLLSTSATTTSQHHSYLAPFLSKHSPSHHQHNSKNSAPLLLSTTHKNSSA